MGRLPRYERTGIRVRQPQRTDFAAGREAIRYQDTLSQALGSMSDFLYSKGVEKAQQAGLERVREEGAVPILESLQAQGGPRTITEKTAYEAANKLAVAEIQTEAELDITKILDEGQARKTPFNQIQAKLSDIADGYAASLSAIDPVSAGLLRNRLTEATGKAESRYGKWWTGEQEKLRRARQNDVAANTAQTILGNAILPGQGPMEIDAEIAAGAQKLRDLGVQDSAIESWTAQVKEGAFKNNYLYQYNQLDVDGQGAAIDDVLSGKTSLPGMDYEDSVRFVNGLLRPEYNRNKSVMTSQSKYVVNKVEDQNKILESGGRVSQDVIQEMRNRASEVAEYDGGLALEAVDTLEADTNLYAGFRAMSLAEMEQTVLAYGEGIEGQGGEGRDTTLEVKRYEQASKFFDNMKTQVSQDPMGYAERVGFIERRQIIGADEQGNLQIDEIALNERAQQAQNVADYYGLAAPKLLFADEARITSLALQQSEGNTKLQILGALANFGEASGQVLTDIADYNPELALVGGLVNSGSTRAANLAVSGLDRIKAGQKPMYFTDAKTDPVYRGLFGQAITTPKHAQAIKGVAKAIYLELSEQRGVPDEQLDESLYQEALQLAAGYREINGQEFGGVQEIRGKPTYIPPSMTGNDLNFILENFNAGGVEKATGQKMDEFLAQSVQGNDSYGFRNIGGNKYVVSYGDQGLSVVGDEEGSPLVFDMATLKDSMLIAPQPIAVMEAQATAQPAQPMTVDTPDLPGPIAAPSMRQRPEFPEARMVSRAQQGKLRKMIKDAGVSGDEFNDRVQPLMRTARDDISDDRYLNYVQSVLMGYNKPFSEWEKENP